MSENKNNKSENVYKTGDIALALAGRDEGRLFAVIAVDEDENSNSNSKIKNRNYVYIADGRSRRADKPKKKKTKHLKLIREAAFELKEGDKLTNAALRKTIESVAEI